MSNESEKKISKLQILEQNFQNLLQQKQNFQSQKMEVEFALMEVETAEGEIYKITGTVMIKTDKEKIISELNSKKETVNIRFNAVEKQEKRLRNEIENLQKEVIAEIGGEKNE
ncbi:prefoldin subunit beta [Candidatus Woesearchaeota archaeon]|nr:prefoldin subunit beta [Candidatus Woesearchaeota archaeon]